MTGTRCHASESQRRAGAPDSAQPLRHQAAEGTRKALADSTRKGELVSGGSVVERGLLAPCRGTRVAKWMFAMRHHRWPAVLLALGAVATGGCDRLAARVEFKQGNSDYKSESYRTAIESYKRGLDLDPGAKQVWRSLGLAAMALYRPGDASPANLAYAKQAVEAFDRYLEAYPRDEKVHEYQLTTLLNSEQYDAALAKLETGARAKPDDARIQDAIVSVLLKAKRFDQASARVASLGPRASYVMNYSLGVACWDRAYRDPMLDVAARSKVIDTGIGALRRAVEQQPDAFESNVYLNLILREQAKIELDPEKQQALLAEATTYQEKAKAIAKAKKAAPAA